MFCKNGVPKSFEKFSTKQLYQSFFFNKIAGTACNFIIKQTLTQVFCCEFFKILKKNFFQGTPPVTFSRENFKSSMLSFTSCFKFAFTLQRICKMRFYVDIFSIFKAEHKFIMVLFIQNKHKN